MLKNTYEETALIPNNWSVDADCLSRATHAMQNPVIRLADFQPGREEHPRSLPRLSSYTRSLIKRCT